MRCVVFFSLFAYARADARVALCCLCCRLGSVVLFCKCCCLHRIVIFVCLCVFFCVCLCVRTADTRPFFRVHCLHDSNQQTIKILMNNANTTYLRFDLRQSMFFFCHVTIAAATVRTTWHVYWYSCSTPRVCVCASSDKSHMRVSDHSECTPYLGISGLI